MKFFTADLSARSRSNIALLQAKVADAVRYLLGLHVSKHSSPAAAVSIEITIAV
jgi:hypothetical protein